MVGTDVEKGEVSPLITGKDDKAQEASCTDCLWVGEKRGKVLILCRSHPSGKPVVVLGPHWPYLIITYLTIAGASAGVYYFLFTRGARLEFTIFGLCLTALVLVSLSLLALVDPGIVQGYMVRKGVSQTNMWSYCDRCSTFRPPRTIHCTECQVCVEQYDHHCPWTGKCVGKDNIVHFHIFVTSLIFLIIYDIVLSVIVCIEAY